MLQTVFGKNFASPCSNSTAQIWQEKAKNQTYLLRVIPFLGHIQYWCIRKDIEIKFNLVPNKHKRKGSMIAREQHRSVQMRCSSTYTPSTNSIYYQSIESISKPLVRHTSQTNNQEILGHLEDLRRTHGSTRARIEMGFYPKRRGSGLGVGKAASSARTPPASGSLRSSAARSGRHCSAGTAAASLRHGSRSPAPPFSPSVRVPGRDRDGTQVYRRNWFNRLAFEEFNGMPSS